MAIQSELPFPILDPAPESEQAPSERAADEAGMTAPDQRAHLRFDKMFAVRVESLLFGEIYCVARNISAGGIFLDLPDPLPLGATARVCFPVPDGSGVGVATGEVKKPYFFTFTPAAPFRAFPG